MKISFLRQIKIVGLVCIALQAPCFSWESDVLQMSPPSHFSAKAEVAVVLPFVGENKILLLQRVPSHPQANLWCAPGGKIHSSEEPSFAAARELLEETGIEIDSSALSYLGRFYVRYPNGDFIFHLFKTYLPQEIGDIKIRDEEHQAYCICPMQDVHTLSLTPGLNECSELALRRGE